MDHTARDWVDTREVARVLGVSTDAALNWPRGKSFPSYAIKRFGRRMYWHLPTVLRWRENRLRALEAAPRGLPATLFDADAVDNRTKPMPTRRLES
jgi:hypothetical protein